MLFTLFLSCSLHCSCKSKRVSQRNTVARINADNVHLKKNKTQICFNFSSVLFSVLCCDTELTVGLALALALALALGWCILTPERLNMSIIRIQNNMRLNLNSDVHLCCLLAVWYDLGKHCSLYYITFKNVVYKMSKFINISQINVFKCINLSNQHKDSSFTEIINRLLVTYFLSWDKNILIVEVL